MTSWARRRSRRRRIIQTARALENFHITGVPIRQYLELIRERGILDEDETSPLLDTGADSQGGLMTGMSLHTSPTVYCGR